MNKSYYCIVKTKTLYEVIKLDYEQFMYYELVETGYIKNWFYDLKQALKYCDIENNGI